MLVQTSSVLQVPTLTVTSPHDILKEDRNYPDNVMILPVEGPKFIAYGKKQPVQNE